MSSASVQPILAMLGDPVGGNPTQYMVEKAFAHHDLDWRYLTFEVTAAALPDAIRGMKALGFCGGHCGNPHKQAVVPLLDRLTDTAATVGSVNVISREDDELVGDNNEGLSLTRALAPTFEAAEKRIVLLGAGKAARAIALQFAQERAAEILIYNRDVAHAEQLCEMLTEQTGTQVSAHDWDEEVELPEEFDLLVQATSIGRETPDKPLPLNLDRLGPATTVVDMTADPPSTWLIDQATERGCPTVDGLTVYIEQVALALERWTGVEADRSVMREAVEEFLEI